MTHKSGKVAERVAQFTGRRLDARYLGYFDCFNRQLFYEAHDVLEDLWLLDRHGPGGDFYKGLIQLAGAFVHLQKNRLKPADALFQLAEKNLTKYSSPHESLDLSVVLKLITTWREALAEGTFTRNPLQENSPPLLTMPE
jgi:predicted metal-dependent hydrolase